jgi:hypothetical protein
VGGKKFLQTNFKAHHHLCSMFFALDLQTPGKRTASKLQW